MRHLWMLGALTVGCSQPNPQITDTDSPPTTGPTQGTGSGTSGSGTMTGSTSGEAIEVQITEFQWINEFGLDVELTAEVVAPDPASVQLDWSSDLDGPLGSSTVDAYGSSVFIATGLSPGWHELTVDATSGNGTGSDVAEVGVCLWPEVETFDTAASLNNWSVYGTAHWDPSGWLEVTGLQTNAGGAMYKTDRKVSPGDVAIEFDVATGGGTGADGFAVNIIDAADLDELNTIVSSAATGGCLGYGTHGSCDVGLGFNYSAFHIEFDTWYNSEHGDQNSNNHIAVALDGNLSPIAYVGVPSLEDLVWRHIRIEFVGSTVKVFVDGVQEIQTSLPAYSFDGGYIGVSGSTGAATNYHRFDNLALFDLCEVPDVGTGTGTTTAPP